MYKQNAKKEKDLEMEKIYTSIRETAEITGLSQWYIRERIKAGDICFLQAGTKYLINMPRLLEQLDRESER